MVKIGTKKGLSDLHKAYKAGKVMEEHYDYLKNKYYPLFVVGATASIEVQRTLTS